MQKDEQLKSDKQTFGKNDREWATSCTKRVNIRVHGRSWKSRKITHDTRRLVCRRSLTPTNVRVVTIKIDMNRRG